MYYVLQVEIREEVDGIDDFVDLVEEYEYDTEEEAKADAETVLHNARVTHTNELIGMQYLYVAMMEYNDDGSISENGCVDELEEINKED